MTARERHEHVDTRGRWGRLADEMHRPAAAAAPRPAPRPAAPDQPTCGDHRAWEAALARPCERHGAEPGALCWDGALRAMCAARTRTLGHASVSRRRKGAAS